MAEMNDKLVMTVELDCREGYRYDLAEAIDNAITELVSGLSSKDVKGLEIRVTG